MHNVLNPHFYGLVSTGGRGAPQMSAQRRRCRNFRNYAAQIKRFRQKKRFAAGF
jgi:hypothetical protein